MTEEEFLIKFTTEDSAIIFLAIIKRGLGQMNCPHCGSDKFYSLKEKHQPDRFKCANRLCYKKFSIFKNTIFENSNYSIRKQLFQILLYLNNPGISTYEVAAKVGISQTSSWVFKKMWLPIIKECASRKEQLNEVVEKLLQTKKNGLVKSYIIKNK